MKTPVVVDFASILILALMLALGIVFRRVVLARASKDDSGYGANHSVIESLLECLFNGSSGESFGESL